MKKRESFSSKPILARPTQICVSCLIRTKRLTNDPGTQRVIRIGMFEIYEQLLPTRTRLWAILKTESSPTSDPTCRLCDTAPESMTHILYACPALAKTKYLARHDAVLKVLFF